MMYTDKSCNKCIETETANQIRPGLQASRRCTIADSCCLEYYKLHSNLTEKRERTCYTNVLITQRFHPVKYVCWLRYFYWSMVSIIALQYPNGKKIDHVEDSEIAE